MTARDQGEAASVPGARTLSDAEIRIGGRTMELDPDAIEGAVRYEFGPQSVTISGWAVARDGNGPVELHLFSGDRHIASTMCDQVITENSDAVSGFRLEASLDELEPAEHVVRAVGVTQSNAAGPIGSRTGMVFPHLPLEPSDFRTTVQSAVTRVDDRMELAYLARWGLAQFTPGTADFASAICVLGYRILDHSAELGYLSSEVWDAIERWNDQIAEPPNAPLARWHISLNTVGGYLALGEQDLERCLQFFKRVASRYGDIARTPISAHNISICTFLAGWIHHKRGDTDAAIEYFRRALVVVRAGLQTQPTETNYSVWNECARMSFLGQQAVWMLGHLDPDTAQRAKIPPQVKFTLKPVLIRVPQLFRELPDSLKTP